MPNKKNKVKYNLKNVHAAVLTKGDDGKGIGEDVVRLYQGTSLSV